jgi:hypothetical protein
MSTGCIDSPSASFHVETTDVVVRLRSALTAMVSSVAGGSLSKSRDAQKYFNVDVKLSWQLFRTLDARDPFDAVSHIPARTQFGKLLREARLLNVNEQLLGELEGAYDGFEAHVERHAGDRTSFQRMLKSDEGTDPAVELPHREAAFEANRQIWGIEKDINLNVSILHPQRGTRGPAKLFEMVSLAAVHGFRRWRVTAPVLLFRHKHFGNATTAPADRPQPLDQVTFDQMGVPIITQFCSGSRPALKTRKIGPDIVVTELANDAVGRLNSIDVAHGQFFPNVALMGRPEGKLGWQLARVNTAPSRTAVIDFIVHRPTFGRLSFETHRWGNISAFPTSLDLLDQDPDVPRLPALDQASYVGTVSVAGHSAGIKNYDRMLRFACEHRQWNPEELDVYRHRVDFPLLSTLDAVYFSIPGSDGWPR